MNGILGFLFVLSGVFVVLIIVGVFWSIRSGQFDDLEGPAARILMDDDDPLLPGRRDLTRSAADSDHAANTRKP